MKRIFLLTAIIGTVFCSSVCAQAVFQNKGERGLLFELDYAASDDVHGFEFAFGYSANGKADFGLGIGSSALKRSTDRDMYYAKPTTLFHTVQFLNVYPVISEMGDGGALILSVHESFGPIGPDIYPSLNDVFAIGLGSSLMYRSKTGGKIAYLLSIGYLRSYLSNKVHFPSDAIVLNITLGLRQGRSTMAFTPSILFSDGSVTFGISMAITDHGRNRNEDGRSGIGF